MGIMDRLRSRETAASNHDFSLSNRLKDLAGERQADPPGNGASESSNPKQTAPASNVAKDASNAANAVAESQTAAPSSDVRASHEGRAEAEKSAGVVAGDAADRPEQSSMSASAVPTEVEEEVVLAAAGRRDDPAMVAKFNGSGNGEARNTPNVVSEGRRGFFQPPVEDRSPRAPEIQNRSAEIGTGGTNPEGPKQGNISSFPSAKGPGQQFLERVDAAVSRAGAAKGNSSGWQAPPEFESIQRQFETDFRSRLDGAMAEFERRFSSQALADDVAEQLEQRIRQAAEKILKEMQSQAWTMHNAVAGELRSFRDQFNKEIQERAKLLDGAALQALQLRESLEAMLPKAEDALRLLSLSEQEISARLQASSENFAGQLRNSHETLSGEIDTKRNALDEAARGFHEDSLRLKEEMEGFRSEAASVGESLTRTAQESIERLNSSANGVQTRVREEMEKSRSEAASVGESLTRTAQESIERLNSSANGVQTRVHEEMEKSRSEAASVGESLARTAQESIERLNSSANGVQTRVREEMEKSRSEAASVGESLTRTAEESIERLNSSANEIQARVHEEMEKSRSEAASTGDALTQKTQESIERVNSAANEIQSRAREEMDKLATETERRILSGGLVEKASEQISAAAQQIVDPAIERMRQASLEANSTADSVASTGERVSSRMDTARQEIEAKLDQLLNEQLSAVENSMAGFQRKATEELGSVVERVVEESSQQMDERLHVLLQDLFVGASKQINGAARASLGTLHDGLKGVFELPENGAEADSGQSASE